MKVTVRSKIDIDGQSEQFAETDSQGKLFWKNGSWYIVYQEQESAGMGKTRTTIKLSGTSATVIRTGEIEGRFVIEKERKHKVAYNTGTGILEMQLEGQAVAYQLTHAGGEIQLKYQTSIESIGMQSCVEMNIEVRV